MGAVVFVGGFFFNQARHNEHFIRIFVGQSALAIFPSIFQTTLHGLISGLVDLQITAACVDFIAVGEELAFGIAAERVGGNCLHEFRIAPAACFVFDVGGVVDDFTHRGKT